MKQKCYKVAFLILVIMLVFCSLWILQRLVMPKYMSDVPEGAMIAEYYAEDKNHDVLFVGDCEVYDTFVPAILWEEYGIHSYVRGSAQQLIWQSYYLLEEMLTYETPRVVVFNVLALKYNAPQKESYNRMTLDGMKASGMKWKAVQASMMEGEEFLDYLFPLLRYHSRITELTKEDIKYFFHKEKVTHNGYYMRVDVSPAKDIPTGRPLGDYAFGAYAMEFLDKITSLCEEKGITLVLVKAPSLYPYWYEEWEEQVELYAKENKLTYINFLELTKECGIDYSTDTYDAGLHLNLSGAEKVTRWFGNFLRTRCGIEDRRQDDALAAIWSEKLNRYYEDKEKKTDRWLSRNE